jgi:outer membrane protein
MKKLSLILIAFVGISFAIAGYAAKDEHGIVDLQLVMQKAPMVAKAKDALQQQFAPDQKKLAAQQKQIKDLMDKLHRDDSIMKAADKKKLQDQASTLQQAYMKDAQAYQQKIMKAQQDTMQQVIGKIGDVVATIAKKKQLSVVLPKSAVLYADQDLYITDDVIAALNKQSS